jgi:hypothetical protein
MLIEFKNFVDTLATPGYKQANTVEQKFYTRSIFYWKIIEETVRIPIL